jgi:enoyl-CoA hydratase
MVGATGPPRQGDAVQHDVTSAIEQANEADSKLTIKPQGSLAIITLNRPRALNALNRAMRAQLTQAFPRFARDPHIHAVTIQSASPKAFSAGGDVRELIKLRREEPEQARRAFAKEHSLNWLHECFSKPTISLINGPVMGSGVGITAYGTHRVGGEGYRFAMPETAIGLFPGFGTSYTFARFPDEIGMYLGLTARAIGAADAYALGLLTHCIPTARFEEIKTALIDTRPVDPLLDERHVDPGPGELEPYASLIARCFSAPTVEAIIERLSEVLSKDREWAQGVIADLKSRSPLSLKVTYRHIRAARKLDLRQTLQLDCRLACRLLEGHDFAEGVRAALIDKDGRPRWQPGRLEDITSAMVDEVFAPMGADELILPTREQMQAARV